MCSGPPSSRRGSACEGADSNVRLSGAGARRSPGTAAPRGLARAMLCLPLLTITKLALPMLLLCGCILPVGPRFEDPEAAHNEAPALLSTTPAQGSLTSVSGDTDFEILVTDPNVSDHLYVRWILDYPPYSSSSSLLQEMDVPPSADHTPLQSTQKITLNCLSPLSHTQLNPLMALVTDRPFPTDKSLSREAMLAGISPTAKKAEAHWYADLSSCPK